MLVEDRLKGVVFGRLSGGMPPVRLTLGLEDSSSESCPHRWLLSAAERRLRTLPAGTMSVQIEAAKRHPNYCLHCLRGNDLVVSKGGRRSR